MSDAAQTMDAETLEALRGSIAKWEMVVAGAVDPRGPDNCPLCLKFNRNVNASVLEGKSCFGCPVFARTGQRFCEGSPYDAFEEEPEDGDGEYLLEDRESPAYKKAAQAELAFLKSLLPVEAA